MNINTTARIDSIIEKRRPFAVKIAELQGHLRSLSSAMHQLKTLRARILTQFDDSNGIASLKDIDFSSILLIEQVSKTLGTLKERFSRRTLNIGVVGLMGQGKSTLLKSLSGLTDREIPAYEGGACTAVRSTIENKQGETKAEVTLHSEDSFLKEVIWPYYDKLGFTDKPTSLDDFASKSFLEQPASGAANEEIYKHLRSDYHYNLEHYRHLITPGTPKLYPIENEKIPEYVIQKRDKGGRLTTFNHLAVREVKIFCPFKNSNVGKIALVDVPGLGDTKLGDEELMLKTLGQEVDIVLFIRRPDPQRYQWQDADTKLYDTAAKALNNLANRSFMILNHSVRIDNLKACESLQRSIDTINVVRCEIADCSNVEDANRIFDLILDYLANNIETLDREYAKFCQEYLSQIESEVSAELDKVHQALEEAVPTDEEDEQFEQLFHDLWETLADSLQKLLSAIRKQRDAEDMEFQDQIKATIQRCKADTGIPSELEEIQKKRNSLGSYGKAYDQYLDEIRTRLSHHFLSLDDGLNHSLEEAKSAVAKVLVEQGRLGGLTGIRKSEFLKAIAEQLPEKRNKLKQGFHLISNFRLSYRGIIQPRIRKHLNGITPDTKGIPLSDFSSEEGLQAEILENLRVLHAEAVDKCYAALKQMLGEPKEAAFAIVEEFIDQVLRAKGMDTEWRLFLKKEKAKVWPDEFLKYDERMQLRQKVLKLLEVAFIDLGHIKNLGEEG